MENQEGLFPAYEFTLTTSLFFPKGHILASVSCLAFSSQFAMLSWAYVCRAPNAPPPCVSRRRRGLTRE